MFGSRFRTLAVLVSDFWLKGIQTGTHKRLDDTIMKTNWSYLRTKGDKTSLVLLRSKESYRIIILTCRLNCLLPSPAAEFMICCSVLTSGGGGGGGIVRTDLPAGHGKHQRFGGTQFNV